MTGFGGGGERGKLPPGYLEVGALSLRDDL